MLCTNAEWQLHLQHFLITAMTGDSWNGDIEISYSENLPSGVRE